MNSTSADSDNKSDAQRLNDRAFTVAIVSLFLPFIGLLVGVVAIIMASNARRLAKRDGVQIDRSPLVFACVTTTVWVVAWIFVLAPAFLSS